jgi:hypothetical protein
MFAQKGRGLQPLPLLINDQGTEFHQDMLCRILGNWRFGAPLNMQIGHLQPPCLERPPGSNFTPLCYDLASSPEQIARA